MPFIEHPLIRPDAIESRKYQEAILNTSSKRNTLCVLPTGLGKTTLAILLAAHRLEKYPESKVLITAPTRPLCAQHQKTFRECMNILEEEIILLTGKISPGKRYELYKQAKIISATPQTLDHDLKNEILDLSNFSLLIVDEVHRAVKRYSYPFVAKIYMKEATHPRILGLTASPGSERAKIEQICKNLFIDSVEIRTELDSDVKPYIKGIDTEFVKVNLSENLKNAQTLLKTALKERLEKLKKYNFFIKTKRELLEAQRKVSKQIATQRKPFMFYLVSLIVEAIKIWHVLELLETQSVKAAKIYLEKVKQKKTKSDKRVLTDINFIKVMEILEEGEEHPKITELKQVLKREFEENKNVKIIVFSHFRDNIHHIHELIQEICRPVILIGQAGERGLKQKEQIDVIKDFNAGYYNCLITSPIGEEGLHIPSADIAIFYDSVPSEIRTIQRRGRVGRTKVGKIIFLLTKGTRDEGYFWTAHRREKKMKSILREMQNKNEKKQQSIDDFT
ncbi:MAG: DEAD/DEAH box helicase [Candidatus Aenigmarchaeota archaeon]|nr:DEAD/DEAH box helicase [Candidatus Aenigmarchaeota archaeon]